MQYLLLLAVLTACSVEPPHEEEQEPADPAWDAIRPVVTRNCTKCHNGTIHPLDFSKKAVFKSSKAKARLQAGTMPPAGNVISKEDKDKLLKYL